jgi:preprotein translocase subunit SecY
MEEKPILSIPVLMVGMIFCVLCSYGFWNVEMLYIGYNSSVGNTTATIYSTMNYGDPYSYIFMVLFYIFCLMFVKAGFNSWKDALETKGQIDYRDRRK